MFSSVGLFKEVDCPESQQCALPNCIFAHQKFQNDKKRDSGQAQLSTPLADHAEAKENDSNDSINGARKKRRLSSSGRDEATRVESGERAANRKLVTPDSNDGVQNVELLGGADRRQSPVKQLRDISPPPVRNTKARAGPAVEQKDKGEVRSTTPVSLNTGTPPAGKTIVESLNPRLLPNPPASHAIRLRLVTMLHEQMVRLNEEVKRSDDPSRMTAELSTHELVAAALNEEEKIAKQNPSVYTNIVKLRIVALKKLKVSGWINERLKEIAAAKPRDEFSVQKPPKIIDTGLSPREEIALLPRLLAEQGTLIKHGYISATPSEEDIEQARKGVEAAQGWEQCDRCKTRFQVFPGRRAEDGALTTGGMCLYHPSKPRRPMGETADKSHKELLYACCNETVGKSTGCTPSDTHVFKISEAKRLALVMPFMATPPNPGLQSDRAVCFDCEMGYTTRGMELIRLTATSWPDGGKLVDVLVRPLGEILDLNSRYSGVWPKDFASAIPHSADTTATADDLQLVDSPFTARALLFSHLTPTTPLIGHALENDLNAVRIIHPCIVDSVVLYPHPRGLPLRLGLKFLLKKHLERDIQMGGELGHDSTEDARAAGDLVRLKVAE
ncbi:RNA exonuclease 3, partial [Pseudocyphellaria aurata]|nr:RNA exonuclease 3 [Pseudocyphellaria aurata]